LIREYIDSAMNFSDINDQVTTQPVVLFPNQSTPVDLLRLDKIHPVISGNKWFKLKEWLHIASTQKKDGLLTFGGAFSNHVLATAFAAKTMGLPSVAIIRGELTCAFSATLAEAQSYGMTLEFVSRRNYGILCTMPVSVQLKWPNFLIIPSGGAGHIGVKGASSILDTVQDPHRYTHICCAVGTGTMLAGLSNAALPEQQVIGICSMKKDDTLRQQISQWRHPNAAPFHLIFDTVFGGYARHPTGLLQFMNQFYEFTQVPTDLVYTGKMMFRLSELLKTGYFKTSDRILAIHSGGLQGNRSLNKGQLIFL
jgi:1-aminocyclopropane-1-carboxylate deaminase